MDSTNPRAEQSVEECLQSDLHEEAGSMPSAPLLDQVVNNPEAEAAALPVNFDTVLRAELTAMGKPDAKLSGDELLHHALQQKLVGLAFSGGGIRSATFNLGVLQGLADCIAGSPEVGSPPPPRPGLLKHLDYLSSVSGGGYIASWFAAWVSRDGELKNVERQLRPNRFDQAQADRGNPKFLNQPFDAEPPPIKHLRRYSNYLTPRVGPFRTNAWTLYSIYIRNLTAIQLILFPLTLAVIFAILLVAWGFVNYVQPEDAWTWLTLGLLPLAVSVGIITGRLDTIRQRIAAQQRTQDSPARFGIWAVIGLGLQILFLWWFLFHLAIAGVPLRLVIVLSIGALLMLAAEALGMLRAWIPGLLMVPKTNENQNSTSWISRQWGEITDKTGQWCTRYFSGSGEDSVFVAILCFIVAAAAFLGCAASTFHSPDGIKTALDPENFLEKAVSNCLIVRELTTVANLGLEFAGLSPNVNFVLLVVVICTLGRLILNLRPLVWIVRAPWRWLSSRKVTSQSRSDLTLGENCLWVFSGIAAGASCGAVLATLVSLLIIPSFHPVLLSIFGAPLILIAFGCGEMVAQAILSGTESSQVREWIAAVGAKFMMAAAAWILLFGLVLSAPMIGNILVQNNLFTASGIAWLGTSIWTAYQAYRSQDIGNRGSFRSLIVIAGPPIFLVGLFLMVSYGTYFVLRHQLAPDSQIESYDGLLLRLRQPVISFRIWVPIGLYFAVLGLMLLARVVAGSKIRSWLRTFWDDGRRLMPWALAPTVVMAVTGGLPYPLLWLCLALVFALLLGRCVNINIFSLQELYQNRLIRCYLGASRIKNESSPARTKNCTSNESTPPFRTEPLMRTPDPLTDFDEADDLELHFLNKSKPDAKDKHCYQGPLHLFCTALNLGAGKELAWQERLAESFTLSPLFAGSEATGYRPVKCQSGRPGYAERLTLGQAVALSGAAVSPNMGYYSSGPVTALLTIFNLRLGSWLGNPNSSNSWNRSGPKLGWYHLLKEALGFTDAERKYVYISDGGHFDNLGVYELIRRRCRVIICCDAGADPRSTMHELGMLIRKVRIDFGIRIQIDTNDLKANEHGFARSHVTVGLIRYGDRHSASERNQPDDSEPGSLDGFLIYIKPGFTGDEPTDVLDYRQSYPSFPHQSTVDQFFSESQFESYRSLGSHIIHSVFTDAVTDPVNNQSDQQKPSGSGLPSDSDEPLLFKIAKDIYRRFEPILTDNYVQEYLQLNQGYIEVQSALRTDGNLRRLAIELNALGKMEKTSSLHDPSPAGDVGIEIAERQILIQMMTVLENVYFALGLNGARFQTSTSGWIHVVELWIKSSAFTTHWTSVNREFSPHFQRFIKSILNKQ